MDPTNVPPPSTKISDAVRNIRQDMPKPLSEEQSIAYQNQMRQQVIGNFTYKCLASPEAWCRCEYGQEMAYALAIIGMDPRLLVGLANALASDVLDSTPFAAMQPRTPVRDAIHTAGRWVDGDLHSSHLAPMVDAAKKAYELEKIDPTNDATRPSARVVYRLLNLALHAARIQEGKVSPGEPLANCFYELMEATVGVYMLTTNILRSDYRIRTADIIRGKFHWYMLRPHLERVGMPIIDSRSGKMQNGVFTIETPTGILRLTKP